MLHTLAFFDFTLILLTYKVDKSHVTMHLDVIQTFNRVMNDLGTLRKLKKNITTSINN